MAFLGQSGKGKSTLAASFAAHGLTFVTDDSLLLEEREDHFWVQPSHPSVRLWDDSRTALLSAEATLAPAVQYTHKARILGDKTFEFAKQPYPLNRIYILGDGQASEPLIEPLIGAEALVELVKNSFLLDIEEHKTIASHFDRLAKLVAKPMFFRLDYPRKYEALDQVRQAILNHITSRVSEA
jgi:hypothetical protein